jgi:hypothetical protein
MVREVPFCIAEKQILRFARDDRFVEMGLSLIPPFAKYAKDGAPRYVSLAAGLLVVVEAF